MDAFDIVYEAISSSTPEEFAELLNNDPNIARTHVGEYDELPIHLAAWQNRGEIIDVLVDAGADIDARGDSGQTALHYAAREGSPAAARTLIDRVGLT
ncbi:MAG: ankyrin repeat domain-containing protein [Planctomycetota bacterium]